MQNRKEIRWAQGNRPQPLYSLERHNARHVAACESHRMQSASAPRLALPHAARLALLGSNAKTPRGTESRGGAFIALSPAAYSVYLLLASRIFFTAAASASVFSTISIMLICSSQAAGSASFFIASSKI